MSKKSPSPSRKEVDLLRLMVKSALGSHPASKEVVAIGPVEVDFARQTIMRDGVALEANAREFRLLKYLVDNEGRVVSRDDILRDVWQFEHAPETRSIDNYILSLRKKIEPDPSSPRHIRTVRGAGYAFHR